MLYIWEKVNKKKMDFKKTFLKLTQWTIPHGYEETITHLLPKGMEKDEIGNYRIVIGESDTLFTCHLDTVSTRMKVNHIIQGDIIRTDGTSILGGDNKAGVCILMYLIEQNIPGTYYFFVGEETGCIGSRWAMKNDVEYFKKFKRAIAFDRKKTGSVITKQRGSICASNEFAEALSKEYVKNGLQYKPDDTGVYTDTAVFMGIIPECTNISAAVWGEHTKDEYVNIKTIKDIAEASARIEWDRLPTKRIPKDEEKKKVVTHTNYHGYEDYGYGTGGYNHHNHTNAYKNNKTTQMGPVKPKEDGVPVDGANISFDVENVPLFFDLTKVKNYQDDLHHFADDDGNIWSITITDDTVSVAKELTNGMWDIVFHESLKTYLPKNFNEMWDRIKTFVTFKRKKKKKKVVVLPIKRDVTVITKPSVSFNEIKEVINSETRVDGMELMATGNTTDGKNRYYDIKLTFDDGKPYEFTTRVIDSITNVFKNRFSAIVSTKSFLDTPTTSQKTKALNIDDIEKVFTLKRVVTDGTIFKERFEDRDGNIYSFEIDDITDVKNMNVGIFKVKEGDGGYKLIFYGIVNSWNDLYDKIKNLVIFTIKAPKAFEYSEKNFDKVFNIVKFVNKKIDDTCYRDVKGNQWIFNIDANNNTLIYLNRSEYDATVKGYLVMQAPIVKSFDDFVKKVREAERSMDPYDKNALFAVIDTYKSFDDEEEEEEDDVDVISETDR